MEGVTNKKDKIRKALKEGNFDLTGENGGTDQQEIVEWVEKFIHANPHDERIEIDDSDQGWDNIGSCVDLCVIIGLACDDLGWHSYPEHMSITVNIWEE